MNNNDTFFLFMTIVTCSTIVQCNIIHADDIIIKQTQELLNKQVKPEVNCSNIESALNIVIKKQFELSENQRLVNNLLNLKEK